MAQKVLSVPDLEKRVILCLIISAVAIAWLFGSYFLSYFWLTVLAAVDPWPLGPIQSPEFVVPTGVFASCIVLWTALCFVGAKKGIASSHVWRIAREFHKNDKRTSTYPTK